MEVVAHSRVDGLLRRGLRLFAMLLLTGLAASGPLLYFTLPHAKTTASVPFPPFRGSGFLEGWWMKSLEVHLRESSPLTGLVRGTMAEVLWHAGLLDSQKVHFGRDGWLFLAYGLQVDLAWWNGPADDFGGKRRRFLRELRQRADEANIALLVAVVPDKDRIYPEKCWPDARLPESKAGLYARIQAELEDAGLARVDGAAALAGFKAEHPTELLFHPADTHWTLTGARVFAEAIRERIHALGWDDLLGARVGYRRERIDAPFPPDLVRMLGFREGGSLEQSLQGRHLGEVPVMPDGSPVQREQAGASVALCGTSYSANGLQVQLPLVLDRAIDLRGVVEGRGPFPGLDATAMAMRTKQISVRLVVWEWPERSVLEGGTFPSGEHWGWLHAPATAPSFR